ncbi:MAG: uroporphyrinogen decarboxylase family protein [Methanomassiliicoccales archaeon]
MSETSARDRVYDALHFRPVDRAPVSGMGWTIGAFAGGYTTEEYAKSGEKMAKGQIAFCRETGVDLLHPTSDVGQMAEGWGVKMIYKEGLTPMLGEFPVKEAEDWEKLEPIDVHKQGRMNVTIEAVRIIRDELGDDVSIMPYIPSPITSSTHIRPMEEVMMDIILNPDLLKSGLEAITETTIAYMDAVVEAGADGVLYAPTRASAEIITGDQYEEFGAVYDRQVLSSLKQQDGMNILHVCGVEPLFEMLADYPNANGINWWDMGSDLNIAEAKERYGERVCLVGGLDQTNELLYGTEEEIKQQAKGSLEAGFDGTGFILAPGCEISPENSLDRVRAAVEAAREFSSN